jgi:hypothetical protein
MKKLVTLLVLVLFVFASCATHVHTVGDGPQSGRSESARQWYVVWGLVPINEVDTADMVEEAEDYEIKTEQEILDIAVSVFLGWLSVHSRNVTVTQ